MGFSLPCHCRFFLYCSIVIKCPSWEIRKHKHNCCFSSSLPDLICNVFICFVFIAFVWVGGLLILLVHTVCVIRIWCLWWDLASLSEQLVTRTGLFSFWPTLTDGWLVGWSKAWFIHLFFLIGEHIMPSCRKIMLKNQEVRLQRLALICICSFSLLYPNKLPFFNLHLGLFVELAMKSPSWLQQIPGKLKHLLLTSYVTANVT